MRCRGIAAAHYLGFYDGSSLNITHSAAAIWVVCNVVKNGVAMHNTKLKPKTSAGAYRYAVFGSCLSTNISP